MDVGRMSMYDGDVEMQMVTNDASDCNEPNCPWLVSNTSQESLNIEEALAYLADIGDTNSVDPSPQMIDLTTWHKDMAQQQLKMLIKNENDIEECASDQLDNWVLSKGLDDDVFF